MAADRTVPAGTVDIGGGALMDAYKEEFDWLGVAAPTTLSNVVGSDAITANANPPITAYGNGLAFWFIPDETNTEDDPNIDVDEVGAKDIVDAEGVGIAAGGLIGGRCYLIVYLTEGDAFRVMAGAPNPLSSPNSLPPGHVSGLILANNGTDTTNDIDCTIGQARDETDSADMVLQAGLTKRLDANFAEGTNQGGLDTGTKANSTLYAVWLIKRPDTGVVDLLFSTSLSSPTMPANYSLRQLIGHIWTDGSGTIRPFWQNPYDPDEVLLKGSILDRSLSNLGTTNAVLQTVTVPPNTRAKLTVVAALSTTQYFILSPTSVTDETPSSSNYSLVGADAAGGTAVLMNDDIYVDASRQVRLRVSLNTQASVRTRGWRYKRDGRVSTAVERNAQGEFAARFDVSLFIGGAPDGGETVARIVMRGDVTFPIGLSESQASAADASTGTAEFSLTKNGVEFGTVTFDTDDAGTFAAGSATSFEAGDVLAVVAPSPADATLSDISITIAGNRSS